MQQLAAIPADGDAACAPCRSVWSCHHPGGFLCRGSDGGWGLHSHSPRLDASSPSTPAPSLAHKLLRGGRRNYRCTALPTHKSPSRLMGDVKGDGEGLVQGQTASPGGWPGNGNSGLKFPPHSQHRAQAKSGSAQRGHVHLLCLLHILSELPTRAQRRSHFSKAPEKLRPEN